MTDCEDISDNWSIESTDLPTDFKQNDIYFVNSEIGYTIGMAGSIMKTIDGGDSWEIIHDRNFSNRVTELKLTSLYFVDLNMGFIGGERQDFGFGDELLKGAVVLKTLDGGVTWSKKYFSNIKEFHELVFFNQLHGISLVSKDGVNGQTKRILMLTDNGGDNWNEIAMPGIDIDSYEFEFRGSSIYVIAKDNSDKAIMLISNDYGVNWETKELPEQESNRIIFATDNIGYVTCGILFLPERVYKTEDRGDSWSIVEGSPMNNYSIVHFVSNQEVIVLDNVYDLLQVGSELVEVVSSFEVFETYDSGKNWSVVVADKSCGFDGPSYTLNTETFFVIGEKFVRFDLK